MRYNWLRWRRVAFFQPGLDIRARITNRVQWFFRMWMLVSIGRWGIAIVRNDGGRGR